MKKILIVEDNVNQLDTLRKILSGNFEVVTATNLEEAYKSLETNLDLILTDLRLDDSDRDNNDGIVLLAEAQKKHPSLPVIMMTAYGGTMIESEARKMGAYDFLQKPINLDELEEVVQQALRISKRSILNQAKHYLRESGPPALFFVLFIAAWESIVKALNIPQYLIPAPSVIVTTIYESFFPLLKDTGITLLEAVLGFLLGGTVAFTVAVAFAHSKIIEKSLYPYFVGLQAVPVIAIAPLLVIWFGNGLFGKVVMAAFICFFPIVVNTTVGFKSVDIEAMELMHTLSATRKQIFFKLRLPSSLPFLFSALKISATLSVIGAIVAELAGAKAGIGFRIIISSYRTDTIMMFASIIFAALSGILFFLVITVLERKFLTWKQNNNRK